MKQTEEYINTNKKYQDLFDIVNKYSGYSNMNLDDEWRIGDCLFVEVFFENFFFLNHFLFDTLLSSYKKIKEKQWT